ncbi:unnamed protein product [Auanema sp. JU1783]|nr:unnamed protein product [Auanema sp. JU1783]
MILDESKIQEGVERKMKELLDSATVSQLNPNTPIQRYYRSILEVHKAALDSLKVGELKKAFVLLVRFCSLVVEKLPKHPQNASFRGEEKGLVDELLKSSLSKAEEIKTLVKQNLYSEVRREENDRIANESIPSQEHELDLTNCSLPVNPTAPVITTQETSEAWKNQSENHYSLTIASDIIDKFTAASYGNTQRNVETCGVLCGKKMNSNYLITHVILPPQVGTSDSCCAEDEMGLFNIQKENNLLTLGWIHTHPTQTAFLSSVDLHTHYGYQSSMDSAIAIVVAPTHQNGIFSLTPEGMKIVGECAERGFHVHSEELGPLFVEAQHVNYSNEHNTEICDLRYQLVYYNSYPDIAVQRFSPQELPSYTCPFVNKKSRLIPSPVSNNATENRILVLLESSSSKNGKLILQLLNSKRVQYKVELFGKNIPALTTALHGRFSLVIIENYYKYLNLPKWNRQIVDKYCSEYHVPIVAFISSRTNDTFERARIKGSRVYLRQNQKIFSVRVEQSKIHRVLRIGATRYAETAKNWVLFEKSDNLEIVVSATDSKNRSLAAVIWEKNADDGVERVLFGHNLTDWVIKTTFHDVLWHFSAFDSRSSLTRFVQVDIDDIFVGARGTRMVEDDVKKLVQSQEILRKHIHNFTYTLGFSGSYYKNGDDLEDRGDELLIKLAKHFIWFPHMWRHNHAHEYNGSYLYSTMVLNKLFAEDMRLPVLFPYAIAPQHDGIYPVHTELFDAWRQVWNVEVTATEEYPHFKPASDRRGFIHRNISVLPRQTCGLYTHTQFFHSYPDGFRKLVNLIEGGELYSTVLLNDISIFMTHQQNFAHDRLAIYTFHNLVLFIECWTNLNLRWQDPITSARTYFELHPNEKTPIWNNPCTDLRHRSIIPPSLNCSNITLPNVVIVGPQKTGSTALSSFLTLHPNVSTNPVIPDSFEELQFFGGVNYNEGIQWYINKFTPAKVVFEKSATYFDNPEAAKQLSSLLPDAKVVVILYNPTLRAYSWYQHMIAHNDSATLSAGSLENILDGQTILLRKIRQRYISGGRYTHHLDRWLEYFPLSQLLLVDGEELRDHPVKVVEELSTTLGLPSFEYNKKIRFSPSKKFFCRITEGKTKCLGGSKGRSYEPINSSLENKLNMLFKPDNLSLQRFLTKNKLPVPQWLSQVLDEP